MRLSIQLLALAASALLLSCSRTVEDYELAQPGGGITLIQRTTMGGGAAGYAWTDLFLRFDGDEKLYPIGLHDHGGMHAEWTARRALLLCFEQPPEWVVFGVLRKGDVSVQIAECEYPEASSSPP